MNTKFSKKAAKLKIFKKRENLDYLKKIIRLEFLRKTRLFNKSRYSRNRQLARVIFYFSLYINILIIYGVFYFIYGISIFNGSFYSLCYFAYISYFLNYYLRSNTI